MNADVVVLRVAFPEWYPQTLRQETINRYIKEEIIKGRIPKNAEVNVEEVFRKTPKAIITKC